MTETWGQGGIEIENMELGCWAGILALLWINCLTPGKLLKLFVLPFTHQPMRLLIVPTL